MPRRNELFWVRGAFFLVADAPIDRDAIRLRAGAKQGTYGAELAQRIIWATVDGLVDVGREWATYFKPEYESMELFLIRHYEVPAGIAARLAGQMSPTRIVSRGYLSSSGDYILKQWLEGDTGERVLRHLLNCAEAKDEDEE